MSDSEEKVFIIYRHLVTENGKSYIGQTSQFILDRWKDGCGYRSCPYFNNAIQKYGWNNIEHIILGFAYSQEEADEMEKYYIQKYRTDESAYGYNLTSGGVGAPNRECSNDTRKKRSNAMKGRAKSEETRRKLSAALKGRISPNKGKPMSESEKEKRRDGNQLYWRDHPNPNLGKPMSEEQKRKISQANKKLVLCIETGIVYQGTTEAAKSVNTKNRGNISRSCQHGGAAYGYHWKYLNEEKNE